MPEVEQHFGDGSSLGLRIRYHYEDRPLGSGRAVKQAAEWAGATGTLVVCNGDILTDIDLTAMLHRHRKSGAALSISLAPVDDPWSYGVVEVDPDLRIRSFVEKPPKGEEPSNLINAGTWLWEPEVLSRIPDDETAVRDGFSERVLFPGVIATGARVQGFEERLWVDVGSPERYLRATRLLLERETAGRASVISGNRAKIDDDADLTGLVYVGEDAVIDEAAQVVGPSVLGSRTAVGPAARIDASVLWEGAEVWEGATVKGSIVGAGAVVRRHAVVIDAVIADGAVVTARTNLPPGAKLKPGEQV
jgi:mannose-1-phosphate guanylyltransferase